MIFVGDDLAEDHHDAHAMDEAGNRLAARRLPEGLAGIGQSHELLAEHAQESGQVVVGIETDRGLWVTTLSAAGYQVLRSTRWRWPATASATTSRALNPMPAMPNCWPIWCAPTDTNLAAGGDPTLIADFVSDLNRW